MAIFAMTPTVTAQRGSPAGAGDSCSTAAACTHRHARQACGGKTKPVAADPGQPWCIAYSPDGKSLAMVSGHRNTAGTYLVWDLATQTVRFRKSENRGLRCVTYSPDNKILALASYDGSVKLVHPITERNRCAARSQGRRECRCLFTQRQVACLQQP